MTWLKMIGLHCVMSCKRAQFSYVANDIKQRQQLQRGATGA